jgi:DNA-binding transcriptional regulator YiaG
MTPPRIVSAVVRGAYHPRDAGNAAGRNHLCITENTRFPPRSNTPVDILLATPIGDLMATTEETFSADDVRALRERCDATQQRFAIALGTSGTSVHTWEAGRIAPSPRNATLLALLRDALDRHPAPEVMSALGAAGGDFRAILGALTSLSQGPLLPPEESPSMIVEALRGNPFPGNPLPPKKKRARKKKSAQRAPSARR